MHSQEFKLLLRSDIMDGKFGRCEAQKAYRISANFTQLCLNQCDNGGLAREGAAASTIAEHELKIAVLQIKVCQLTKEFNLVKPTRSSLAIGNERPVSTSGALFFPSDGDR